jgi:hypothetical protein
MSLMKLRSLTLLVLLVVTSALPLLAAGVACADMPCHRQSGERMMAPMPCCTPSLECAQAAPLAQPAVTVQSNAPVAAAVTTALADDVAAPAAPHSITPRDTSPPAPTRARLAKLATLLI